MTINLNVSTPAAVVKKIEVQKAQPEAVAADSKSTAAKAETKTVSASDTLKFMAQAAMVKGLVVKAPAAPANAAEAQAALKALDVAFNNVNTKYATAFNPRIADFKALDSSYAKPLADAQSKVNAANTKVNLCKNMASLSNKVEIEESNIQKASAKLAQLKIDILNQNAAVAKASTGTPAQKAAEEAKLLKLNNDNTAATKELASASTARDNAVKARDTYSQKLKTAGVDMAKQGSYELELNTSKADQAKLVSEKRVKEDALTAKYKPLMDAMTADRAAVRNQFIKLQTDIATLQTNSAKDYKAATAIRDKAKADSQEFAKTGKIASLEKPVTDIKAEIATEQALIATATKAIEAAKTPAAKAKPSEMKRQAEARLNDANNRLATEEAAKTKAYNAFNSYSIIGSTILTKPWGDAEKKLMSISAEQGEIRKVDTAVLEWSTKINGTFAW